jgi:hypothetical protein
MGSAGLSGTLGTEASEPEARYARPRNRRPNRTIHALAQMPTPRFVTLATAAINGAPTTTPKTRRA